MSGHGYSHHSSYGSTAGAEGIAILAVAVLVLLLYLSVRLIALLYRVFSKYPRTMALWISFGVMGATGLVALITLPNLVTAVLFGLTVPGFVLTCKIIDTSRDTTFAAQKGPLLLQALSGGKNWWN
jgi:hypothetical protein